MAGGVKDKEEVGKDITQARGRLDGRTIRSGEGVGVVLSPGEEEVVVHHHITRPPRPKVRERRRREGTW